MDATSEDSLPGGKLGQSPEETPKKDTLLPWQAAAATLFAIGAISTVVQFVTALSMNTAQYFDWRWSTGGLLALVAAIFMWAKAKNWQQWRRGVLPWLVVTGLIAFGSISVQSASVAPKLELPDRPSFGVASHWTKVDEPAKYEWQYQASGKVLVDYSGIRACHLGQPWHECINDIVDEYNFACVGTALSDATPKYRYARFDDRALTVCDATLLDIQDMQAQGGAGYIVTSLGSDKLIVEDEQVRVRVQKEPERVHVAVCYLGLFGECR